MKSFDNNLSEVINENIPLLSLTLETQQLQQKQTAIIEQLIMIERGNLNAEENVELINLLEKDLVRQTEFINGKLLDIKELYKNIISDKNDVNLLKRYNRIFEQTEDIKHTLFTLEIKFLEFFKSINHQTKNENEHLIAVIESNSKKLTQDVNALVVSAQHIVPVLKESKKEYKHQATLVSLTVIISAFLIVFLIKVSIKQNLLNYLGSEPSAFENATKEILNGKLNVNIQANGGAMEAIKLTTDNLNNLIRHMRKYSERIAVTGQQLNSVSQQISSNANEQALSTAELLSALERLYADIIQSSEYAQDTDKISSVLIKKLDATIESIKIFITSVNEIYNKSNAVKAIVNDYKELISAFSITDFESKYEKKDIQKISEILEQGKKATEEIIDSSGFCSRKAKKIDDNFHLRITEIEDIINMAKKVSYLSVRQKFDISQVDHAIQQINSSTFQNIISSKEMHINAQELSNYADMLRKTNSIFKWSGSKDTLGNKNNVLTKNEEVKT